MENNNIRDKFGFAQGVNTSVITNTAESTRYTNATEMGLKEFTIDTQTTPGGRINFYNGIDQTETFSAHGSRDMTRPITPTNISIAPPRVSRSLNFT